MAVRSTVRRPAWGTALIGLILLSLAAYLASRPASSPPAESAAVSAPQRAALRPALAATAPGSSPPVAAAPASDEAAQRLLAAQTRLSNYRAFALYPPDSRPASEHPDQLSPRAPVVRTLPLAGGGRANDEVRVQLGQDRRELVGDDSARLWVRCEDSLGKPLPCAVERAVLTAEPGSPAAAQAAVPVEFSDDGRGGDERAQDGTQTALIQPATQGFARHQGLLRVQLSLRLGSDQGSPFFDLTYTGSPPARFTGRVRESIAEGSLQLALGVQVSRPGRYFVVGRVDDADGKPVAYLEWNGELSVGEATVPLRVFGKLIHDLRPRWPLLLRDVEGYLFFEDATPDRAHLSRLAGAVHKTATYPLSEFSDREWDSEQKRRYLDEFEKDVAEARREAGPPAAR
jgi:hypothetical protein